MLRPRGLGYFSTDSRNDNEQIQSPPADPKHNLDKTPHESQRNLQKLQ